MLLICLIFPISNVVAQDMLNQPQTIEQAISYNAEIPSTLSLTLQNIADRISLNTEKVMTGIEADIEQRLTPDNYDPRTKKHKIQYLYGQCVLGLHTSLLKQRLPMVSEEKIEDFLINSKAINFRKRKTIAAEFCRYNTNFTLKQYGSELENLVQDSGGILAELNKALIDPNALARIKVEAETCQKKQEKEHRIAMFASNDIYTGNRPPVGWETLEILKDSETGFYAEIQRELNPRFKGKAKIMVVFRGTEIKDEGDGKANFTFGFHQLYNPDTPESPNRMDYTDVMEKLMPFIQEGHEIVFTGHSLGGGLAQGFVYLADQAIANTSSLDNSLRKNLSSVTFGSFGARPLIDMINDHSVSNHQAPDPSKLEKRLNYIGVKQTNYISESDPIPGLGYFSTGQVRELYYNDENSLNPHKNHSIERQIEWLNSDESQAYGLAGAYPIASKNQRTIKVKIAESIANFVRDDKTDGKEDDAKFLFNFDYDNGYLTHR